MAKITITASTPIDDLRKARIVPDWMAEILDQSARESDPYCAMVLGLFYDYMGKPISHRLK